MILQFIITLVDRFNDKKYNKEGMKERRLGGLAPELLVVLDYFNVEKLKSWASEIFGCEGKHDREDLLDKVRRITRNPEFLNIRRETGDYLNSNASWEVVDGVLKFVPRGFISDTLSLSELMIYSRVVPHGLSEEELVDVYKYHCVEMTVENGERYGLSAEESLITLADCTQKVSCKINGNQFTAYQRRVKLF